MRNKITAYRTPAEIIEDPVPKDKYTVHYRFSIMGIIFFLNALIKGMLVSLGASGWLDIIALISFTLAAIMFSTAIRKNNESYMHSEFF